jgi:hypothetical protein
MIVDQTKLKQAVKQALEEVNDALYELRQSGIICLMPEFIDFQVQMVTGTDINAITRTATDSEADGGSAVTTRAQVADDVDTVTKRGDKSRSDKFPSVSSEETKITHPSVQTTGSGADNSDETVKYEYEEAD